MNDAINFKNLIFAHRIVIIYFTFSGNVQIWKLSFYVHNKFLQIERSIITCTFNI